MGCLRYIGLGPEGYFELVLVLVLGLVLVGRQQARGWAKVGWRGQ